MRNNIYLITPPPSTRRSIGYFSIFVSIFIAFSLCISSCKREDPFDENTPLDAPKILSAKLGNNMVTLEWSKVGHNASYEIECCNSNYETLENLYSDVRESTFHGLDSYTTYYFRVRAVKGDHSTPRSDWSEYYKVETEKVYSPVSLTLTGTSATSLSLSWPAEEGVTSYKITYRDSVAGIEKTITGITGTNCTIEGLSPGIMYYINVYTSYGYFVVKGQFSTSWGTAALATPNLSLNTGVLSIIASWQAVKGATKYYVTLTKDSSSNIYTTSATTLTMNVTTAGTYKVSVRAFDGNNYSQASTTKSINVF